MPVKYINRKDFTEEEVHCYDDIMKEIFSSIKSYLPKSYIYLGLICIVVLFPPIFLFLYYENILLVTVLVFLGPVLLLLCIFLEIKAFRRWRKRMDEVLKGHEDIGFVRGNQFFLYKQWQHYAGMYFDPEVHFEDSDRARLADPPGGIDKDSWPGYD